MAHAVPAWVAPGTQQVVDCTALASVVLGPYGWGIAATLRWVLDAAPSPVVGTDGAATVEAAEEEFKTIFRTYASSASTPCTRSQTL